VCFDIAWPSTYLTYGISISFHSALILRLVTVELESQVPAAIICDISGTFKEMVEIAIKIETQRVKNKLSKK
jgi:hypothetical protein